MKSDFSNWSDVRIFLAVFRQGSTLAASRILGIAQPTVARRIDALEAATNLTLFERDTRGFKPTHAARDLFPLAQEIEAATAAFAKSAQALTEPRTIRITAPGTFADCVLDLFSDFSAANPNIAFDFVPSIRVLDLSKGEADIAVRVTADVSDGSLICRKIRTAKWALFGSQRYADERGFPKSEDDFRGHRFVTFEHADVPDYLHRWLTDRVTADQIVQSFRDVDLMQAAIRSGQGLGLVNIRQAQFDAALMACFGPIDALSRSHMLLISPDAYRRPEVKTFVKFFAPRYAATFDQS
ncbi:LysR family transcriptional regulator [Sulfitobacter aestuariivivens]|uniref:LysR family transcriptional regulator n=1 Tax=Sulfitobacter aestuariivivens TaxID=2766981 RepID=A0A927D2V8_9RHOB|nr:LysR family transcriptional regulator [Sulfitobacter aestuariivivens]MBD3662312.1 LysR family transcriptional regulator [Sulfitobacter aestuariivivens]